MTGNEQKLIEFSTHMRLLISKYQQQSHELENTKQQLHDALRKCEELQLRLNVSETDYRNLKTARMLEIGDGDIQTAKDHVAKLIRDVNKAITLLNGELKDSEQ